MREQIAEFQHYCTSKRHEAHVLLQLALNILAIVHVHAASIHVSRGSL